MGAVPNLYEGVNVAIFFYELLSELVLFGFIR